MKLFITESMLKKKSVFIAKKTFDLTKYQRQVIVGTLLGDAHAETQNNAISFRLKFEQSHAHRFYLFHLYEIFKNCCGSEPYQKANKNWAFSTFSSVNFSFYGKYFYNTNKTKRIPKNIGRFLTPISLAYWFMDDGSIKSKESKGVILNTHAFSLKEIELIIEALDRKFSVKAIPRRQKDGYQIYISGHSYEVFFSLIESHLHASMLYKVPKPRKIKDMEKYKCLKSNGGVQR